MIDEKCIELGLSKLFLMLEYLERLTNQFITSFTLVV